MAVPASSPLSRHTTLARRWASSWGLRGGGGGGGGGGGDMLAVVWLHIIRFSKKP